MPMKGDLQADLQLRIKLLATALKGWNEGLWSNWQVRLEIANGLLTCGSETEPAQLPLNLSSHICLALPCSRLSKPSTSSGLVSTSSGSIMTTTPCFCTRCDLPFKKVMSFPPLGESCDWGSMLVCAVRGQTTATSASAKGPFSCLRAPAATHCLLSCLLGQAPANWPNVEAFKLAFALHNWTTGQRSFRLVPAGSVKSATTIAVVHAVLAYWHTLHQKYLALIAEIQFQ